MVFDGPNGKKLEMCSMMPTSSAELTKFTGPISQWPDGLYTHCHDRPDHGGYLLRIYSNSARYDGFDGKKLQWAVINQPTFNLNITWGHYVRISDEF